MLTPVFPIISRLRWLALVVVSLGLSVGASAQITFGGTIDQFAGAGTVQITAPITFTVTATGNVGVIVLDNWVTSDGSNTSVTLNSGLSYTINGGSVQMTSAPSFFDNFAGSSGDLTADDGIFFFSNIAVTIGDTFSLLTGSYTTGGDADFNSSAIQTFTGDIFLADGSSVDALSGPGIVGAVPEPSTTAALAGLAVLGLTIVARRRRKIAA